MTTPWRRLLLIVVCAVLTFGGTFTCRWNDDDDDDFHDLRNETSTEFRE